MRFREYKQIIDENFDNLIYDIESSTSTHTTVINYFDLVVAINNIAPLNFIDKELENLHSINTPLNVQSYTDSMSMDTKTYSIFLDNVQTIINKCNAVKSTINHCLPEQNELSVTIGLPKLESFKELADFNLQLEKIFKVFLEDDADKISVQNFDSGSLWTEIAFASVVAMSSFGTLISLTSYLFTTIRKHKIAEMQLDELEYDQKIKESLKTALHNKAMNELEGDVKTSLTTEENTPTPEKVSSTTKAVSLLFDLLDKGTTFEAALNANEKIQKTYPSLDSFKKLPTTANHKISTDIPKMISENQENIDD